jgi:hypothetical protein
VQKLHNTDELYMIVVVHNVFSKPAICGVLDDPIRLIDEKRLVVAVKGGIIANWESAEAIADN